jgi:hypothetical protein|tara:strand:+ start:302 stop:505 length:204 start_codon:yes stop_codon:yes gene_type:complete
MAGRLITRGFFGYGEKKDLRFHPNNPRRPDCGLAMEIVFVIDRNIRIMFGLMILSMKEQKTTGPFGF